MRSTCLNLTSRRGMSLVMDNELLKLVKQVLSHFDMDRGDMPSCSIYAEGRMIWGLVGGELEQDLRELYDLVEELEYE